MAAACHAEGVVVLTCGTYGNVLRFLPPLVMPDDLLDEGLDVIETAFGATGSLRSRKSVKRAQSVTERGRSSLRRESRA